MTSEISTNEITSLSTCGMLKVKDKRMHLLSYQGNDEFRILVFGALDACFDDLYNLFEFMSKNEGAICELHNEPFVVAIDDTRLTLKSVSYNKWWQWIPRGIQRVSKEGNPIFDWYGDKDEWEDNMWFLASIMEGGPGFNSFSNHATNDADVIIAKGRYDHLLLDCCPADCPCQIGIHN